MFHGSIVALITPMKPNGDLDNDALEALVYFHLENNTDAIVAMGTTGECVTLTYDEHIDIVKRVVEIAEGRCPVIAGTGSNNTREAVELTEGCKAVGADACLLVAPFYNRPMQEGLYQHYRFIAESVAIPQILYNVPSRTGCDILPDTVDRLADIPNIVAIKEATGDLERAKTLIERCSDRLDVLSGDDGTAMELMLLGGKGDVSVTANVAPKLMHEMCQAAIAGQREQAEALNNQLIDLHSALFLESNPIPAKWAMYKMGYGDNALRLPLTPFSDEYHATLLNAMLKAGIQL